MDFTQFWKQGQLLVQEDQIYNLTNIWLDLYYFMDLSYNHQQEYLILLTVEEIEKLQQTRNIIQTVFINSKVKLNESFFNKKLIV
ncbi:unnamed protein product [Paramecium octaurelia]|uniref:Uncharacterized protein n=1 Tax=Paramecium octaurelia TaxID=43137 RepID=A0A8S1VXR3_PAROT|nr:unnamed protein product [Paramecium octaurelia]